MLDLGLTNLISCRASFVICCNDALRCTASIKLASSLYRSIELGPIQSSKSILDKSS